VNFLIAVLAHINQDVVNVAAKAHHHNSHTAIQETLIPAIVNACHHHGILSNLFQSLNNHHFSRSLLLV
jgi:hypothetical protein